MQPPRLKFTVMGLMKAIVVVALCLWPIHYILRLPYEMALAQNNGTIAGLCEDEAKMMMERAKACSSRAAAGSPWDDPGEEAETLKICPYPNDRPRHGSWLEQSAVWERAAQKGMRTARFYGAS